MGERPMLKYLPCHCRFFGQEVWAMLMQQPGGTWKVVNCLDKDRKCYQQPCTFTVDGGGWPFVALSQQVGDAE